MKQKILDLLPYYILVLSLMAVCGILLGRYAVETSAAVPLPRKACFIIDAGHGGVDGGAVSCTGMAESHINLQIALRLEDLMHLLGYQTKMIRSTDISIYTEGTSISGKKASDLRNRVQIVNETENGILLSIHQNFYADSFYSGAQVFYPKTTDSKLLAQKLQAAFIAHLNPTSHRQAKNTEGLYLFSHIEKTGVLIECGFLSNYEEEAKLRTDRYQKEICVVIAATCAQYITEKNIV